MTEAEPHHEVDVGNGNTGNSITLTPNTGVSIGMIVTIIGAAIWITSGQARLEARSQRLEELVVDLKQSVAATSSATRSTKDRMADHEAWARSEAVRMRMAMNEERRKLNLPQIQDTSPYSSSGGDGRRQ